MINPSATKYVYCYLPQDVYKQEHKPQHASYNGQDYEVILRDKQMIKAGNRRLYIKYSIFSECYYLTDRP